MTWSWLILTPVVSKSQNSTKYCKLEHQGDTLQSTTGKHGGLRLLAAHAFGSHLLGLKFKTTLLKDSMKEQGFI